MRTRTGPAWATARRILPSCGTWHSTSCRRMARRKRCAASFSGPDGTMPISPASLLYSEVQLPCLAARPLHGGPARSPDRLLLVHHDVEPLGQGWVASGAGVERCAAAPCIAPRRIGAAAQ